MDEDDHATLAISDDDGASTCEVGCCVFACDLDGGDSIDEIDSTNLSSTSTVMVVGSNATSPPTDQNISEHDQEPVVCQTDPPTSDEGRVARGPPRWSFGKAVLGGIIASVFISYYALLETTCASTDPNEGAGELVITLGGSAKGTEAGTRFLAPLLVNSGSKLAPTGTADAELLWFEDLCDQALDCSSCPFVLHANFNASRLRAKILLYSQWSSGEVFMCGLNRLGRTFGAAGLVGLGQAYADAGQFDTPGGAVKLYRLGEHRDSEPRDGDAGIPFPHFHATQYAFSQFLLKSGIREGAEVRAVLTPTAPNPWLAMTCGYWKPLEALLVLGHTGVAERATSNWIGHVRTSGLRFDLAQFALATELVAHVLMALLHHDPFLGFHWAAFPNGAFTAFLCGSFVLTCSSTLLLAAYWCVGRLPVCVDLQTDCRVLHHPQLTGTK